MDSMGEVHPLPMDLIFPGSLLSISQEGGGVPVEESFFLSRLLRLFTLSKGQAISFRQHAKSEKPRELSGAGESILKRKVF
jgi:hypothetical protein